MLIQNYTTDKSFKFVDFIRIINRQHYRRVLLDSRKDDFSEEQLIELYHYIREQNNWSEFSSMRSRYYDCHYSDKHLRTQSRKISNAIRRKYQCMSQEDLDALLAQEMEKRSKWPPVSQMPGADSKMHLRKKTFTKSKARSISASKEVFPISPKSTKDDSFINHYTRSATKRLRDIGFVEKNEPAQQPRKVVSRQIKKAKVEPSQIENNMELESSTTEILSADDIERAVQISNDVEKLFKMHEAGLYIDSNADYLIQLENIQACFDETPDLTLGTNDNSAEKPIFNFSYWL